jgi:hypothetical protein
MVKIEDVTTQILEGTATLNKPTNRKKIQENITRLSVLSRKNLGKKTKFVRFMRAINTFFCNRNFSDVRLVGAPPTSIGKFGSDTDNWVWPRHTGDFSLFNLC